ncbi:MAG: hypothetical protein AB7S57_24425 [Acetobacteraceae bacterium]
MPATRDDLWNGPRIAGWLATDPDRQAAPSLFAIRRETRLDGGATRSSFVFPGAAPDANAAAFENWLLHERISGAGQCSVVLLLISEVFGPDGLLAECVMERRLGAVDGPFIGHPARVAFAGGARSVRLYGIAAESDGGPDLPLRPGSSLILLHPAVDGQASAGAMALQERFAGEESCLRGHFPPGAIVLARRRPTLLEEAIGLSAIVHVRDGSRVTGCGIGWHGPLAFLLLADFPRLDPPPELPAAAEAAIAAALRSHDLLRNEVRTGLAGTGVMARRPGTEALFLLLHDGGQVRVQAYQPNPTPAGTRDQQRWVRYAERHEHRRMLDVWLDGPDGNLIALAADPSGEVWRHVVDRDSVEVSRLPANDTAMAELHRERLMAAEAGAGARAEPPGPDAGARPGAGTLVQQARDLADAVAQMPPGDTPFGQAVADRFPEALFHIQEARRCLLFRRPTATVFHLAHVLRVGAGALMRQAEASAPAVRTWAAVLAVLETRCGSAPAMQDALRAIRAHWGTGDLTPRDRYTEEEAALLTDRVGRFMTLLAERCSQPGTCVC